MRLQVSTPFGMLVDVDRVRHLRAEDETGAFGILPGHADFVTALVISVVTWRDAEGREHHVAVRGGVLDVSGGDLIAIATREAVTGDRLDALEADVLVQFRRRMAEEQEARTHSRRLYLAAIRQIQMHLHLRPNAGGRPE